MTTRDELYYQLEELGQNLQSSCLSQVCPLELTEYAPHVAKELLRLVSEWYSRPRSSADDQKGCEPLFDPPRILRGPRMDSVEDFEKALRSIEEPIKPVKSTFYATTTHTEDPSWAEALKAYEDKMVEFRAARKAADEEYDKIFKTFKAWCITSHGLQGHPKANKAFDLAVEWANGSGLSDIKHYFGSLSELLIQS